MSPLDEFTITNGELQPASRDKSPEQTAAMKRAFLAVFTRFGSVGLAARSVGIGMHRHYRWLRIDGEYARKFEMAKEVFVGTLEKEALRRAVKGVPRKKFYKGDPIIDEETGLQYVEHEFSDQLLMFLMKANAPQKYRPVTENLPTQNNVSVDVGVVNATQTNINNGIRVIEHDNWYGNADRLAAPTDAACGADPDGPGSIQTADLRETLGENG